MKKLNKKYFIIGLFSLVFVTLLILGNSKVSLNLKAANKFTNDFSVFSSIFDKTVTSEGNEEYVSFTSIHNIINDLMNDSSLKNDDRDILMSERIVDLVNNKKVAIATAEELYNFSVDSSYNWKNKASADIYPYYKTIEVILGLDYVLTNDIDYSTMKSKQFVPIGMDFTEPDGNKTTHYYPFSGSFNGNGFKISNLYLAGYDYISMVYRFTADDESTEIDISLNKYYSMFSILGEDAVLCNLIIENPIFELLDIPDGLTRSSILVGENKGVVYNTAVIDTRTKINNESFVDDSGMSWSLQFGSVQTATFYASGLVNVNNGYIYNSYYISSRVVKSTSSYLFKTYPIVCENNGVINGVVYNEELICDYKEPISGVSSAETNDIKSGNGININTNASFNIASSWHFYPDDTYPSLIGLDYDNDKNCFLIKNATDLVKFSKLLSYKSKINGKTFNEHTYLLVNNIDMKGIQNYETPKVEFKGILKGGDSDFTLNSKENLNKCILNLNINIPYNTESEIYYGLVGINKGTIQNINFVDCSVSLVGDNNDYGKTIYAGVVCAYLNNGNVKNIVNSVTNENNKLIDCTNSGLGKTYIGGLVGKGNGLISYCANINGVIDGNGTHNYTGLSVSIEYCYGGIIGASLDNDLTIEYCYNNAIVKTIGTESIVNFGNNKGLISAGGIIGEMNNSSVASNKYFYLTNNNKIIGHINSNSTNCDIYVGGIFARSVNKGFESSNNSLSGRLENKGIIQSKYNSNSKNYLAGIGINASNNKKEKYSYMINVNGYEIDGLNCSNWNKDIYYSSTILDNGNGIELSRSYNEASYEYVSSFFNAETSEILIAPFFTSVNNSESELVYCQNDGNITINGEGGTSGTTVNNILKVSGITQNNYVDYSNVYMCGDIKVNNIKNDDDLYVSGISWILPTLNGKTYKANNCLNEGSIITSNISGDTSISNVSGTGSSNTSFSATLIAHNLYVGGLFNLNVGKITNSMNRGEITSNDGNSGTITGTCNTFVGGIVTFNYNYIQDCANSGDILYFNSNVTSNEYTTSDDVNHTTKVAGGDEPNCLYGGLIFSYNSGVALGGIACAMADTSATILTNYSDTLTESARILDTSNNGNISGKANQYVRCGGILAIALGVELTAGTDSISSTDNGTKKYSWCTVGNGDKIANCILSNGLNFGNITSVSNKIGYLSNDSKYIVTSGSNSSEMKTQHMRPGIFACSGGVISYGLCVMTRMLNHGVITSTDVAGGIVGATYVLGTANTINGYTITNCSIDTAIHYGKVKAAKYSNYTNFTYDVLKNITNTIYMNDSLDTNFIYKDENEFIFPNHSNANLSIYPNDRRGFGGIFGRLQRGNSGVMEATKFENILNMDEKVDMVGRADGSSYAAYYYYRLNSINKKDTYYSARTNDTTPALIVGYITAQSSNAKEIPNTITSSDISSVTISIGGFFSNYGYKITAVTFKNTIQCNIGTFHTRQYGCYDDESSNYDVGATKEIFFSTTSTGAIDANTSNTLSIMVNRNELAYGTTTIGDLGTSSFWDRTIDITSDFSDYIVSCLKGASIIVDNSVDTLSQYQMELVTDDETDTTKTYIFNDDFPLMDANQANYIYAASNDVLADRFRLSDSIYYKPNGMYVLASTKGRDAGDVLPGNLKINNLYKLNEDNIKYIDLSNVDNDDLISSGSDAEAMLSDYKSMFQLNFSDKSLIQQTQEGTSKLYDIVLYDKYNNLAPVLRGGVVGVNSNGEPTITFNVSSSAFNFVDGKANLNYVVQSATLSENAVIAKNGITSSEHSDFKDIYENRSSNIIDGNYEASISGVINQNSSLTFSDKIRVYSEIACQMSSLVEKYYTDYTVIINQNDTTFSVNLDATVDNNTSTYTVNNNSYALNSEMLPDGNVKCLFTDVNKILPNNHEIKIIGVYVDLVEVSDEYYSLEIIKLDQNVLGFYIEFGERLKTGTYEIKYKYFENLDDEYSVLVNKKESSYYNITNIKYNTFSNDLTGIDTDSFVIKNSDFTTYIQFGMIFDGISYNTSNELDIETVYNEKSVLYLNNVLEYIIKSNNQEIERILISSFASLESVSGMYEYTTDGNRAYVLTYNIKDEGGNNYSINHTIIEREPNDIVIYKNNNLQYGTLFTILREDELTTFDIDFGFEVSEEELLNQIKMLFNNQDFDSETMKGKISQSVGTYYTISISSLLESGTNEYKFVLVRDEVEKELLTIFIEKLLGKNAYLENINFQIDSSTLVYPDIYQVDSLGNVVSSNYDIRSYYGGIDYDGADINDVKYFRIDGKITNIGLDSYSPDFENPIGSKVYRYAGENWNGTDDNNWSEELEADFIGTDESKDTIILYKVVSEDGTSTVYYFITVTDMLYNLTIRFTIYYRDSNGNIVLADNSPIKDKVTVITIKNYALTGELADYQITIDPNNPNHVIYPYEASIDNPTGITDYITGLNNQLSMFYYPTNINKYQYSFGRNYSGCYGFSIIPPVTNGNRHTFDIYLATGAENIENGYGWNNEAYLLPNLDESGTYDGKYFFISGSTRNRIREFALVINEETLDNSWGLTDDFTSWNN